MLDLAGKAQDHYDLRHASLSNTQKYTHLAMVDIIDAYNIAHPRA